MKFIPGNYYRCRNGSKVLFVAPSKHAEHSDQQLIFELLSTGKFGWHLISTNENGTYERGERSSYDIISEWEEESTPIQKAIAILQNVICELHKLEIN